jgi:aspartate aminotransferase-like enzyme
MGLDTYYERHRDVAEYTRGRVKDMGLETLAKRPSNALTVVKMPDNLTSTDIIQELKEKHGILFANGQGELRGTIIRIGHMGDYTKEKMRPALDALEQIVRR